MQIQPRLAVLFDIEILAFIFGLYELWGHWARESTADDVIVENVFENVASSFCGGVADVLEIERTDLLERA